METSYEEEFGLIWAERYNIYIAGLGGLEITVAHNSTDSKDGERGYKVSVSGVKLKKLFPDYKSGMYAGIKLAKRMNEDGVRILAAIENKLEDYRKEIENAKVDSNV